MKVAILTTDNIALFELGCAVELFSLPRPEIKGWYQTEVVSFSNKKQLATGGIKVITTQVENFDDYEMLVIPSWPIDQNISKKLSQAIEKFHKKAGRVISFCSGAFLLAEVGLLDQQEATTHWRYAECFKERYPKVKYLNDVLYCYNGNIGCSAGSSAGIDLGIEIIRQDYGSLIANKVARRLVIAAHRNGGQSQFVEMPVIEKNNQFSETLDWMVTHLNSDKNNQKIDINCLAKKANMSRRTFDRKFRQSLNMSPNVWLIQQRINRVKDLLETTNFSIDRIAMNAGFENAVSLRHHFKKVLKLSPTQFRQQFNPVFLNE